MPVYLLTELARNDLIDIWYYTYFKWSEEQANLYFHQLILACQQLAFNPNKGKSYHFIQSWLLGYRVKRHIIFYRIIGNHRIEVIRILHAQMELKNGFK